MEGTIVRRFWLDLAKMRSIEEQKWIGLQQAMTSKMPEIIFMRDGAPAHTAKLTQEWGKQNLPAFWQRAEWPGNSPDLNPIENLWSILKDKVEEFEQASTVNNLIKNLEKAWSGISELLQNMVSSMPRRVALVLERQGDYIGK